jgi:cytochrome c oxidase subunit 3
MWLAIGAVTMLFAALTSAYVVRFGEAQATNEWGSFSLPRVLWLSSAVLIGSSVTFEFARRALKKDDTNAFSRWILVTTVLGIGFLAGQLAAWQQLRRQDIYVGSNPHSSFFFVLTGTHGLHLICGVFALLFVAMRRNKYSAKNRTAVEVTSIYWHFMDGLWIYLFLLLSFWR